MMSYFLISNYGNYIFTMNLFTSRDLLKTHYKVILLVTQNILQLFFVGHYLNCTLNSCYLNNKIEPACHMSYFLTYFFDAYKQPVVYINELPFFQFLHTHTVSNLHLHLLYYTKPNYQTITEREKHSQNNIFTVFVTLPRFQHNKSLFFKRTILFEYHSP